MVAERVVEAVKELREAVGTQGTHMVALASRTEALESGMQERIAAMERQASKVLAEMETRMKTLEAMAMQEKLLKAEQAVGTIIEQVQSHAVTLAGLSQQATSNVPGTQAVGTKGKKEILESKATASLEVFKDPKVYRTWMQKLRNAFDQARPGSRQVLGWIESLSEKEVLEEKDDADDEMLEVI